MGGKCTQGVRVAGNVGACGNQRSHPPPKRFFYLRLIFEIDREPALETLTWWGGVPLLVRAYRSLGLAALRLLPLPTEEHHHNRS